MKKVRNFLDKWYKGKRLDTCFRFDKWWGKTNKKGQTLVRQMVQRIKFRKIFRVRQMIGWDKWKRLDTCFRLDKWWGDTNKKG